MFRSLLVFYILSPIIFIVAWILLPFVSTLSYCFYHEMYKGYLRKGMTLSNYAKSELSKIQWDLVRFLFNQVIMTAVDIGTDIYQAYEYYSRYSCEQKRLHTPQSIWSKTTLITSNTGRAGVNPAPRKIDTFILRSLALSVPTANLYKFPIKWR